MANALYALGRQKFLDGQISWSSDAIKVYLVRDYTPDTSVSGHEFLDDVTGAGGEIVATSASFTGKTSTGGTADADDVTYSTVAAGDPCAHLVIAKDTGTEGTSPLIAVIDTATGLPITPNGGDITIQFDDGSNKIFTL